MLSYYRILLTLLLTSFSRITRSHLKWTREATFICNRKMRSPHCRNKTIETAPNVETNCLKICNPGTTFCMDYKSFDIFVEVIQVKKITFIEHSARFFKTYIFTALRTSTNILINFSITIYIKGMKYYACNTPPPNHYFLACISTDMGGGGNIVGRNTFASHVYTHT
jgi:hypothetical protein